jgi:hypothetical protein
MSQGSFLQIDITRKAKLLFVGVWIFVIITFVIWNASQLLVFLESPAMTDFRRFWAAGHLLAKGLNPYDLKLLSDYSEQQGAGAIAPLPFYYPVSSFTLLLPLSLLPFQVARYLYLGILIVLYFGIFLYRPIKELYLRLCDGRPTLNCILEASVYFTFFPFFLFWWNGGITFFPFIGVALFLFCEELEERSLKVGKWKFLQGLSLSLVLVKPSVCFLVLVYLVAVWFSRREWGAFLGLITGFLILLTPAVILLPSTQSLYSIGKGAPNPLLWLTPTASSFIQTSFNLPTIARLVLPVLAAIFVINRALQNKKNCNLGIEIRRIMLPLSLVTAPYAWTYDFVLLLFSLSFIISKVDTPDGTDRFSIDRNSVIILLILNLFLAVLPYSMELHWWYPVTVLILCIKRNPSELIRRNCH